MHTGMLDWILVGGPGLSAESTYIGNIGRLLQIQSQFDEKSKPEVLSASVGIFTNSALWPSGRKVCLRVLCLSP